MKQSAAALIARRRLSGGRRPKVGRPGFSLMEVILATAILLGSVVVLSELAGMGRRQSLRGREMAEAQQLCEQTLNELLTGLRPLEPQEQEPLLPVGTSAEELTDEELFLEPSESLDPFAFDDESPIEEIEAAAVDAGTAPWLHSLRITPLENHPGLAVLSVVVEQAPEVSERPVRFELSRWIDEPFAAADERAADRGPFDVANRRGPTP
ncbi:MAG: hypothetical protein AB7U20_11865 [Planctomycetaceae bacterium]